MPYALFLCCVFLHFCCYCYFVVCSLLFRFVKRLCACVLVSPNCYSDKRKKWQGHDEELQTRVDESNCIKKVQKLSSEVILVI